MNECSRRRFLVLAPAAAVALPAVLSGCGGSSGTPVDGTVTVQNGKAALSFAQFPQLQSVGGAVVVSANTGADYLVIRTGAMDATALSAVCTHAHCLVGYQASGAKIVCPCHGSEYAVNGAVTHGPSIAALATFPATLDAAGITIAV